MMSDTLTIRGRIENGVFIPEQPLPSKAMNAQLVMKLLPSKPSHSVADAFGKASQLRSGAELIDEIRAARDEWDDQ
jgi:hypothetical protein